MLAVVLWQRLQPRLPTDVRRDLLLDLGRVTLLSGFEGHERLSTWTDVSADPAKDPDNPDRDAIGLLVPRRGVLRWDLGAHRPGELRLGVARLVAGPVADEAPCELVVDVDGATTRLALPPAPADAGVAAGRLREGPSVPLVLDLPRGAAVIALELRGGEGFALLLSPHVVMDPAAVEVAELVVDVARETRLLPRVTPGGGAVLFAQRRRAPEVDAGAEPARARAAAEAAPREEVSLPAIEPVSAFAGPVRDSRQAVALTGPAVLAVASDVPPGAVLVGALALDSRLPPGSAAGLAVRVDGEEIARLQKDGPGWAEFRVPLGSHAGPGRRLELAVVDARVTEDVVEAVEPDYARRRNVTALYEPVTVRVGVADPRIVTSSAVARRTATAQQPSVLLIHVETLRADALVPWAGVDGQAFGAPPDVAPHLAALAARASVWRRAMAPSSWTVPSTASLLTGLPPCAHGATTHLRMALPGDAETLAERAAAAGVATGAVVASDLLSEAAGYARGFQSFAHVPYANARQVHDLAEAFLANHAGQQFLLFLHEFDPHSPYAAPEPWRDRYVPEARRGNTIAGAEARVVAAMERAAEGSGPLPPPDDPDLQFLRGRYLGEIAFWDAQLGALLDALEELDLVDSTIVVVTADHGEEFLEHGLYGHGSNLHEETLHVPLLAAPPPGWRAALPFGGHDEVVGTDALHASVLEWMAVPFDADAVRPPLRRPEGFALSVTSKGVALVPDVDPLSRALDSVRTGGQRVIVRWPVPGEADGPWHEAFDLVADPAARSPLPEGEARRAFDTLRQAEDWCAAHRAAAAPEGMSPEQMRALEQLGYLGGQGGPR